MKFNKLFFAGLLFLGISTLSISSESSNEVSTNTDEYYILKEKHLKEMLKKVDFSAIDLETNYSVSFTGPYKSFYQVKVDNVTARCSVFIEESVHVIFVKNSVYQITNVKNYSDGSVKHELCDNDEDGEQLTVEVFKKPIKSSMGKTLLSIETLGKADAQKYEESSTKQKNIFLREGDKLTIDNTLYGPTIYHYNQRPLNMHDIYIDEDQPEQITDILDIPDSLLNKKISQINSYNAPFVGWLSWKMKNVKKLTPQIELTDVTLKEFIEKVAGPQICK